MVLAASFVQSGGIDVVVSGVQEFVRAVFSMDFVHSTIDTLEDVSAGVWVLILFVLAGLLFVARRD